MHLINEDTRTGCPSVLKNSGTRLTFDVLDS
jgi:hypothetical protein